MSAESGTLKADCDEGLKMYDGLGKEERVTMEREEDRERGQPAGWVGCLWKDGSGRGLGRDANGKRRDSNWKGRDANCKRRVEE